MMRRRANQLPPWRRQDVISEPRMNGMQGAIPTLVAGRGIEIRTTSAGDVIGLAGDIVKPRQTFWATLGAAEEVAPLQWEYAFTELVKAGPGYAGWNAKEDGRTGHAFNLYEVPNDPGAGLSGVGVNLDTLPGGFSLLPAPAGVPVLITVVTFTNGSDKEHWFGCQNPIDGTCAPQTPTPPRAGASS